MYPHSLKEELSSGLYCDTLLVGCHDGHIREFVDDHENTIVSMLGRREACHVIHGDIFSGMARSIHALVLDYRFGNGAGSAGYAVLRNILSKVRPIKILLQHFHYFFYSKM